MNWGYKILITIIVFVLGMVFMVTLASKQKNEMLDENYYQKEIKFQEQIDASKNLQSALKQPFFNTSDKGYIITFPAETVQIQDTVWTELICMQNKNLDIIKPYFAQNNSLLIPKPKNNIKYTLRVHWTSRNKPYYYQTEILNQN